MPDRTALTKAELLSALEQQDAQLQEQDAKQQEQDAKLERISRERDEFKLAWEELLRRRFRNHSERYLDNPDQLRLDFDDSDDAADAATGLGEAVEALGVDDVPDAFDLAGPGSVGGHGVTSSKASFGRPFGEQMAQGRQGRTARGQGYGRALDPATLLRRLRSPVRRPGSALTRV